MEFTGEEVRKIRESLGISPREFANLIGATHQTVLNWERAGGRKIRTTILHQQVLTKLKVQLQKQGRKRFAAFVAGATAGAIGFAALLKIFGGNNEGNARREP